MPRPEVTTHTLQAYDMLERFKLFEEDIMIDRGYRMLTRYSQGRIQARAHDVRLTGIELLPNQPSILNLILTHAERDETLYIRPNIHEGRLSVLGPQLSVGRQWAVEGYLVDPTDVPAS